MASIVRLADTPFPSLREAMERFDRLFEQAFGPWMAHTTDGTVWRSVPMNVYEDGNNYYGLLLAPGADPASFQVTAQDGSLIIEGELKVSAPEGVKPVWQEFGPSRFRRQLTLPSGIDTAKAEAVYKNGVLMLTLPKAEGARAKTITVKTEK